MRKLSSGLKIEDSEIQEILQNEVLKREVIEGEVASKAKSRVKRISGKPTKKPRIAKSPSEKPLENPVSFSEKLLKESGGEVNK